MLTKYTTAAMVCLVIFVEWMERCHWWWTVDEQRVRLPTRSTRCSSTVCIAVCLTFWNCYSFSIECEVIVSLLFRCKKCNNDTINLRLSSLNTWNHAVGAGRTARTLVLGILLTVWSTPKLLFVFDFVRDHSLTLILCCPCRNMLPWRWSLRIYLRWMHATISHLRWTSRKYVCIAVFLSLKLLFVFSAVLGRYIIFVSWCPFKI